MEPRLTWGVVLGLFGVAAGLIVTRVDGAWLPITGAIAGVVLLVLDPFNRRPPDEPPSCLKFPR